MTSEVPLKVKSIKTAYLEDYPIITKHDNIEVIREFIHIARKEVGVVLTYEDILYEPVDMYKPYRKIKQVAFDA